PTRWERSSTLRPLASGMARPRMATYSRPCRPGTRAAVSESVRLPPTRPLKRRAAAPGSVTGPVRAGSGGATREWRWAGPILAGFACIEARECDGSAVRAAMATIAEAARPRTSGGATRLEDAPTERSDSAPADPLGVTVDFTAA